MNSLISDPSIDLPSNLQPFAHRAAGRLLGIRNCVLIYGQGQGSDDDLSVSIRELAQLEREAKSVGQIEVADLASRAKASITDLAARSDDSPDILPSLDLVARIEKMLLALDMAENDFLPDVSGFVDASFDVFGSSDEPAETSIENEFEVDEETLEIFRSEASDLLAKISNSLKKLSLSPGEPEFLWDIRRSVHTLKGAAGIVGLSVASDVSHRLEDILDGLGNNDGPITFGLIHLFERTVRYLEVICLDSYFNGEVETFEQITADLKKTASAFAASAPASQNEQPSPEPTAAAADDPPKPAKKPIVRVSLERLDELIQLSSTLTDSEDRIIDRLESWFSSDEDISKMDFVEEIVTLLDAQRQTSEQIVRKIARIRMVRFGTLETRLGRAVHVTCQEEGKKATFAIENPDTEIDTQMIDAMIEPMLHLIKNAVVHGVEPVETRRLIGKPESGRITVTIDANEGSLSLTIRDDGRGISASRLIAKALEVGAITEDQAAVMNDDEACQLIFSQGLTTAEKLDLNAGRGLGMCIVKESVEACGGTVTVNSEPHIGTSFIIRIPLTVERPANTFLSKPPRIQEPVESKNTLSVLVVDDSPSVRRHNCKIVESLGHRTIAVENGLEGFKLLQSQSILPDLILSDVEMPTMDGLAFLNCVKSDPRLADLPVVMVTSFTSLEAKEFAINAGASDYLPKPLTAKKVLDSIAKLAAVPKHHLIGG